MTINTFSNESVTASPVSTATMWSYKAHSLVQSVMERIAAEMNAHYKDERGMSTIEYALGCVAAAALGALLYMVVTSDTVEQALSGIFERALNEGN